MIAATKSNKSNIEDVQKPMTGISGGWICILRLVGKFEMNLLGDKQERGSLNDRQGLGCPRNCTPRNSSLGNEAREKSCGFATCRGTKLQQRSGFCRPEVEGNTYIAQAVRGYNRFENLLYFREISNKALAAEIC
jgi:hypothetical protein